MAQTIFPSNYSERLSVEIASCIRDELSLYNELAWGMEVTEQAINFCLGGKLARGSTFVHLAKLLSKSNSAQTQLSEDTIFSIGVAIELFGSALLIHDDIIDRDAVRRGQPTIHTQYSQWAASQNRPNPSHDGTIGAILLADILLFLVNRAIVRIPDPAFDAPTLRAVLLQFSRQALFTGFGELMDSIGDPLQSAPTEATILELYRTKTAHYTLSMPLTIAAIVSKQTEEQIAKWDAIGELVGTIFQIKDDELGLFGDPHITGKAVGADIRENKQTLYYLYTRDSLQQSGKTQELHLLNKAYGNQDIQPTEIALIADLMTQTGTRKRLDTYMQQLANQATALLEAVHPDRELREWFKNLLDFNRLRNK